MAEAARKKRLGELLQEEGLIDRFQLQAALAEQKKWGGRLGKHLIELGILSEDVLVKVLSKMLSLPSVDVGRLTIAKSTIDYVPVKTAEKFNLIPIGIEETAGGKRTLIVAMSDPTNLAALDELRFTTGCGIRPVVSGDGSIERAIRTYYYGAAPQQPLPGNSRARPAPLSQVDASPEMVIMRGGEPQSVKMSPDGGAPAAPMIARPSPSAGGVVPGMTPDMVGSLPQGALTPVDVTPEENARRLNALMRVLVRRKVMTEEEFLAELRKG